MNNFSIPGVGGGAWPGAGEPATAAPASGDGERFGDLLSALREVEAGASAALTDLAVDGEQDLHDVVLAVEMESIAFELAISIRNRLVDAYQEIFRMSV